MRIARGEIDDWMVRVALTRSTGAGSGTIERHTALVGIDPMPGVHFFTTELGRLDRANATAPWRARRTSISAIDGERGAAIAASVYDAAHGFLALGLPPLRGPVDVATPDQLVIEVGDSAWSFDPRSAPADAWLVLRAARDTA